MLQSVAKIQGKEKTKADIWLKSPLKRAYKKIVFEPFIQESQKQNSENYNLWKGFAYEPRRRELLTQALNKIKLVHPQADVGIFDPRDKSTLQHKILIGSIQACDNNFKLLQDQGFEMLVIDEAHHASAPSYIRLIRDLGFNTGDKWLIGFTATPERADKEPLPFKINSFHLPIIELVNKEHLVRPSGLHIELGIDLSTIAKDRGDFQKQSLKKVMLESLSREIVVNTIQID